MVVASLPAKVKGGSPMPRRKFGAYNLQIDVPPLIVQALDMLAMRAHVSRSALVRAVLSEYIELKMGPRIRKAIAVWETHGKEVIAEFMRQQLPDTGFVTPTPIPLEKLEHLEKNFEDEQEKRPPAANPPIMKVGPRVSIPESVQPEFAIKYKLQAPRLSEEELVAADPDRIFQPDLQHFSTTSDEIAHLPPREGVIGSQGEIVTFDDILALDTPPEEVEQEQDPFDFE